MAFVCGPEKGHESIGRSVAAAMRRVSGTGRTPLVAQADATRLGSWLHGIVHMAEPAEGNARHWYRAAGRPFPGLGALASEMGEFGRGRTGLT